MTAAEIMVERCTDMLTPALAGHAAGLCIVRVKTNGDKRPVATPGYGNINKITGEIGAGWKKFQTERPTRTMVEEWFKDGYPGIGVFTGEVSGRLEMLEFEGRAVHEGVYKRFITNVAEAGLTDLVDRITAGYLEETPSDGLHIMFHVADGR